MKKNIFEIIILNGRPAAGKSEVIDFVILQQDAFDSTDRSSSMERQQYMMKKVLEVYDKEFQFNSFEEVNPYFKKAINMFKQMNYSDFKSESFYKYEKELNEFIASN